MDILLAAVPPQPPQQRRRCFLSGSRVESGYYAALGEKAVFAIEDIDMREDAVTCSVTKDGGDDPDATHGAKIFAKVKKQEADILLIGGRGVGLVTAKGLQCKVGEPANQSSSKKDDKGKMLAAFYRATMRTADWRLRFQCRTGQKLPKRLIIRD